MPHAPSGRTVKELISERRSVLVSCGVALIAIKDVWPCLEASNQPPYQWRHRGGNVSSMGSGRRLQPGEERQRRRLDRAGDDGETAGLLFAAIFYKYSVQPRPNRRLPWCGRSRVLAARGKAPAFGGRRVQSPSTGASAGPWTDLDAFAAGGRQSGSEAYSRP